MIGALYDRDLSDLHRSSGTLNSVMKLRGLWKARHVLQIGETRNSFRIMVGKWLPRRSRRNLEDNS
jgi:hypothetical protein